MIESEAALRSYLAAEGVQLVEFFEDEGALELAHELPWLGDLVIEASIDRAFADVPNYKLVTPKEKGQLSGLMAHYAKKAHPFTACVTDNTKRFGKDRAERICAVLKDLIRGTTSWRNGGEKKMAEFQFVEPDARADFLEWFADVDQRAFGVEPEEGDREYAEFETVDLNGVHLLSSGGPYFGAGSPKAGDYYDDGDLQRIANNNNMLTDGGELHPFVKVGHNEDQRLLKESGFYEDEQPATGDLRNFRVEKGKLLADARGVPKKLAQLITARAFPRRSIELKRVVSQKVKPGEKFDVVTAVGWLGAKAPAIRTLDDVVGLYGDGDRAFEGVEDDLRFYALTDELPSCGCARSVADYAAPDELAKKRKKKRKKLPPPAPTPSQVAYFDPNQRRDRKGRWTETGAVQLPVGRAGLLVAPPKGLRSAGPSGDRPGSHTFVPETKRISLVRGERTPEQEARLGELEKARKRAGSPTASIDNLRAPGTPQTVNWEPPKGGLPSGVTPAGELDPEGKAALLKQMRNDSEDRAGFDDAVNQRPRRLGQTAAYRSGYDRGVGEMTGPLSSTSPQVARDRQAALQAESRVGRGAMGVKERRQMKKLRGMDAYLAERINYGGEIKTRGEVISEMQAQGTRQVLIDRYMQGAKTLPSGDTGHFAGTVEQQTAAAQLRAGRQRRGDTGHIAAIGVVEEAAREKVSRQRRTRAPKLKGPGHWEPTSGAYERDRTDLRRIDKIDAELESGDITEARRDALTAQKATLRARVERRSYIAESADAGALELARAYAQGPGGIGEPKYEPKRRSAFIWVRPTPKRKGHWRRRREGETQGSGGGRRQIAQGGLNWGGQIFKSAKELRGWIEERGGKWEDFKRKFPAAHEGLQRYEKRHSGKRRKKLRERAA